MECCSIQLYSNERLRAENIQKVLAECLDLKRINRLFVNPHTCGIFLHFLGRRHFYNAVVYLFDPMGRLLLRMYYVPSVQ